MRHRRRRGALLWGGLTALGVVLLGELGWFAGLEFRAYDAMLRRWPARASDDRVAIIEIRDDDLKRLGRWPCRHWVQDHPWPFCPCLRANAAV